MQDARWTIDPEIIFLNHGSFGACPRAVLEVQADLRARMEREPVHFLTRELGDLWEGARAALAKFVGADPAGLVFVNNATTGVNTVLRSLDFKPGDQILMIDHGYSSCLNAAAFIASKTGAERVVAKLPFPIGTPEEALRIISAAANERTKVAVIDHITSPTGMVLPIEKIVRDLEGRGINVLVDGAHAPGMVELNLDALGASWYTGNCHKWLCTPKGAALLWVRKDHRANTRPLVISHGANAPVPERFHREFDWLGTNDPTAVLSIPSAIEWLGAQVEGGWPALRKRNRELLITARRMLLDRLSIAPPCPESMLGTLAAIPLPDSKDAEPGPNGHDRLHDVLFQKYRIEAPVPSWPAHPRRLVRVAAQLYNRIEEYQALADALIAEGASEARG